MPRKVGNKDNMPEQPEDSKFDNTDYQEVVDQSISNTSDDIQKLINESSPDNAVEATDSDIDKDAFFKDPEGEEVRPLNIPPEIPPSGYIAEDHPGMTLNPKELYEGRGFDPAVQVKPRGKDDFEDINVSQDKATTVAEAGISTTKTARPATKIDLANVDESMIMNMPEIKAASFEIIDILNPKPKSPSIRFKWANYKNAVAGNLGRLKSLGFEVAHVDDVDMGKSKIDPSMIEGTQVKYYDVILLKIDTIRLMSLYKANIMRSVSKLSRVKEKGILEAQNDFKSSVSSIPGASLAYNKMKEALGGKEPVQFFVPTE